MLVTSACTTPPGKPEYKPAEVIERMEGHTSTPAFAIGNKTMWNEGSDVIFAHILTMSGNSRPDGCMKAASLQAKSELLQHIKSAITTSGQVQELNAEDDPGYESLTAFLSQGTINGAKVVEQYWQRVEESEATTGERVLRLKCASKVAVSKSMLAKMLRDATGKAPGGDPKIREALLNAQTQFLNDVGQANAQPAH